MPTDPATSPLPVAPSPASSDDAAEILHLRDRLVDWMQDRGISQWQHGDVSEEMVRRQAERGQWWLIRSDPAGLIAAVRILSADPQIWGEPDQAAVYVHGLMVNRGYAGHGLGRQLLDWAAEHGRHHGAEVLRLDCVATNPGLCDYYLEQGFTRVGTKELPPQWRSAALFERSNLIGRTKIRMVLARGSCNGHRVQKIVIVTGMTRH
ncbi:GNAT family N-acetyltransferase [Microlunatus elymi]|uniref:GNAT family N-acetyltransferase n=1 Tax=Microlunatus elymi TaxID=2596828 RepID=A0A516PVV5_9ACTN|nr:GNAT family N-acetyltransferase [Microlunatus elymi]QDP95314.1 GNAT family N-acetyltransferase [Microlunatus elymi]